MPCSLCPPCCPTRLRGAAHAVVGSRGLTWLYPQFNLVLDDTDALFEELHEWKRPDLSFDRPPPLVIEVYLDTANLSQNQALVIADETGKRWDVADALAGSADSSPRPTNKQGGKFCEVVLERWTIELGDLAEASATGRNEQLPNVYKKGVVLFRSLYTFLRFLPTWKLYRRVGRHTTNGGGGLRVKYRLRQGGLALEESRDSLFTPLFPHNKQHTERQRYPYDSDDSYHDAETSPTPPSSAHGLRAHRFEALATPSGPLRVSLLYRHHCDFAVASAEALLSSRFGRRESDPLTTTMVRTQHLLPTHYPLSQHHHLHRSIRPLGATEMRSPQTRSPEHRAHHHHLCSRTRHSGSAGISRPSPPLPSAHYPL